MPLQLVEDNTIGNMLANSVGGAFERGPTLQLKAMSTMSEMQKAAAEVDKLRFEMRQKQEQDVRDQAAMDAYRKLRMGEVPDPTTQLPSQGLDAQPQFTPQTTPTQLANRDLGISVFNAGIPRAKDFNDTVTGAAKAQGLDIVRQGTPTTYQDYVRTQGLLKSELPDIIPKAANGWMEIGPNNIPIPGRFGVTDNQFRADSNTGEPLRPTVPGGHIVPAPHISADRTAYGQGDKALQLSNLGELIKKERTVGLSSDEQTQKQVLINELWPVETKIEKNPATDELTPFNLRPKQVPNVFDTGAPAAPSPAATGQTVPPPTPAAPSTAAATTGSLPPPMGAPAAPAAAAAAPRSLNAITPGTPLTAPGPASDTLRRTATALVTADREFRENIAPMVGYDPETGKLRSDYYVPGRDSIWGKGAAIATEKAGTSLGGQAVAKYLEGDRTGQPNIQDFNAAQLRWTEQVLRLASGAAINPSEYASYFSQFFPNFNDTPAGVKAKMQAMQAWSQAVSVAGTPRQALEVMNNLANANPALRGIVTPIADTIRVKAAQANTLDKPLAPLRDQQSAVPAAPAAPAGGKGTRVIGQVYNGQRYKGGDVYNQGSYEPAQ